MPRGRTVVAAAMATLAASIVGGGAGSGSADAFSTPAIAGQDLVIVGGTGVLGRRVAQQWRERHGETASIYAVSRTLTDERRAELEAAGCTPMTQEQLKAKPFRYMGAYSNVVFCAPPSGNEDYVGDVRRASELWNGAGGFVFTSSSGVYAEESMGTVTEDSPVQDTERATKLLAAEKEVTSKTGTALRLSGLYTTRRGPHAMFLKREELDMNPDGTVNMIHYSDAASAVVNALLESVDDAAEEDTKVRGKVLHVADGAPVTRKEICEGALASPIYAGASVPKFTQPGAATGKLMDLSAVRRALPNWAPQYASFGEAMASIPEDSED
mmetsp:Transcript_16273/g.49733  ORF Transcript_16273/g.49733 Transcript_16273/m.49733 type:complete len:327 (-) Transcript_16273:1709-2689(-)